MHTLVLGQTMCGKSSLAKTICAGATLSGTETVVFNPTREPGWYCTWQSSDIDRVKRYCEQRRKKMVFLDECSTLARNSEYDWFTTAGRHAGNSVWLMAQRLAMLSPNLRANTVQAFVFRSRMSDVEELADNYNEPRLAQAAGFGQLQFIAVANFPRKNVPTYRKGRLDYANATTIESAVLRGMPSFIVPAIVWEQALA